MIIWFFMNPAAPDRAKKVRRDAEYLQVQGRMAEGFLLMKNYLIELEKPKKKRAAKKSK